MIKQSEEFLFTSGSGAFRAVWKSKYPKKTEY